MDDQVQGYLAASQRLGVGVCWIGEDRLFNLNSTIPQVMAFAKEWVSGTALKAVAGTDRRPSRDGGPGWFLRNVRGVGPGLAAKLHQEFGSTGGALEAALLGTPEAWRKAGANKAVRRALGEAMR